MPAGIPSSNHNVAPRAGLAWRPSPKSPWVVRAGTGLFYDRYPLAFLNDALQKDGIHAREFYVSGPAAAQAFSTGMLPGGLTPSRYGFSSNLPSTYAAKVTVGVERLLDRDTTISIDTTLVHGLHLPRTRNIGLPGQAPNYLLENTAESKYAGATATINRRITKDVNYIISYTVGRARDDASDYDEQPFDPRNTRRDWALSKQHQLHRITASGLFEPVEDNTPGLPGWLREPLERITIAPLFTYGSGRPLNALDSADSTRTAAYPISARPFGLGRNPFYSKPVVQLDLRVFKTIEIKGGRAKWFLGVESFNILNRANFQRVSPFYASGGSLLSSYGRPAELMNNRQVQLFAALEF